ncbi:MAG: diacylglycerol kinase family lipid kinase [Treponema sp.]|jgi:YegS/Rv2252/BmrU family lipid kinase|nr:diacylglycerol kinase family lipid kinase [Treponema sp.]
MSSGKIWVILNPTAGKGKAETQYPKIESFLKERGENFEFLLTKGPGDAIELAQNLPLSNDDIIVAAGGDGTCNEVVNGLLTRAAPLPVPPTLGILPIGRGNDFAYAPGIPNDIEKALDILAERKIRPLDVGFVKGGFFPEGRYFVNGVGIGFDTQVGFDAAKMKHVKSGIAYAFGAIKNIIRYDDPALLQVTYDKQELTLPATIFSVMNGKRMGGSFYMGPDAKLDDGLFDFCTVHHPKSRMRLIQLVAKYTKGTQGECEDVSTGRAAHFHIKALEGGMAAHADGETLCYDGKELEMTCIPSALKLIGA